jgi:hypothetical protein
VTPADPIGVPMGWAAARRRCSCSSRSSSSFYGESVLLSNFYWESSTLLGKAMNA